MMWEEALAHVVGSLLVRVGSFLAEILFPHFVGNLRDMLEDARARRGNGYARRCVRNVIFSLIHEKHSYIRDAAMTQMVMGLVYEYCSFVVHWSWGASILVAFLVILVPILWFQGVRRKHAVGLYSWSIVALILATHAFDGYAVLGMLGTLVAFLTTWLQYVVPRVVVRAALRRVTDELNAIKREFVSIRAVVHSSLISENQVDQLRVRLDKTNRRLDRLKIAVFLTRGVQALEPSTF